MGPLSFSSLDIRATDDAGIDRSPLAGRIAYAAVCLLGLAIVSGCFSLRVQHLTFRTLIRLPLIRLYLLAVYLWGIGFIISVAILRFGFGITTESLCLASILLCLVFYVVDKVLMYLFLVERVHVVRRKRYSRRTNHWYIINLAIIALGFGSIAVFSFMDPVAELSPVDGKCRIGLPFKITLPLLIYDVCINVYLTAHFVYFARPHVNKWPPRAIFNRGAESKYDTTTAPKPKPKTKESTLERLARRTLKGMCVMLLGTIINLAILFHMRGREQEWMCFMFCTIDVTVGIVTLHWVTSDPSETDLGRTDNQRSINGMRQSLRPCSSSRVMGVDSVPLKVVTSNNCDAHAWADDQAVVTVPNRIVVTTSYGCDEHREHPLKTKRMSSVNTSSIDGERLLSDEDKEPRLEPM